MKVLSGLIIAVLALAAALWLWRQSDRHHDRREWQRLQALQPDSPKQFDPALLKGLPEPAKRYFAYSIKPGAKLYTVAEIDMHGQFGLGNKANPHYQNMQAHQILAAPYGFVWSMSTESGMPISGSDTALWTRFRLLHLIPVARQGGNPDHRRSAFGRYIAEAAFWTPAALLPGPGIQWETIGPDSARVTVTYQDLTQAVDIHMDADGQPLFVRFQRWSNANQEGVHRLQPFGGYLSDFREVQGYRLPFQVEAGNMFGTDSYFPFFKVAITDIRFPES